ncbi:MAG: FeoA family protein [Acetobacterium sp.]
MPLIMAKAGECNTIKRITGKDETKRFLENMGFIAGGAITIVSEMGGNMIVNIKGTRVAISKSMAKRIMV